MWCDVMCVCVWEGGRWGECIGNVLADRVELNNMQGIDEDQSKNARKDKAHSEVKLALTLDKVPHDQRRYPIRIPPYRKRETTINEPILLRVFFTRVVTVIMVVPCRRSTWVTGGGRTEGRKDGFESEFT